MARREIIIKETHRGLYYEDGVLTQVLGAGRHALPRHVDLGFYRTPRAEVTLVDVRERELTIKGQEILTSDKVAIRVSLRDNRDRIEIVRVLASDEVAAQKYFAQLKSDLARDWGQQDFLIVSRQVAAV